MTEAEWLVSEDLAKMLPFGQVNNRKLRLWCAALFDASSHPYPNWESDLTSWRLGEPGYENQRMLESCVSAWSSTDDDHPGDPSMSLRADLLRDIVGNPWRPWFYTDAPVGRMPSYREMPSGFIPKCLAFCRVWLTPQVLSLAQAAYDDRADNGTLDNDRLAVLSDALEEAGCPAEAECPHCFGGQIDCFSCGGKWLYANPILAHLRSSGPHVRGCRVIDLLLQLS